MLHVVKSWERPFGGAHTDNLHCLTLVSPRATSRRRCKGTRRAKEEGKFQPKIMSYLGISQALPPRGSTPRLATTIYGLRFLFIRSGCLLLVRVGTATTTEGAQRCIFVGKGKEVYVLICVIGSSPRRFDSARGHNNFNV